MFIYRIFMNYERGINLDYFLKLIFLFISFFFLLSLFACESDLSIEEEKKIDLSSISIEEEKQITIDLSLQKNYSIYEMFKDDFTKNKILNEEEFLSLLENLSLSISDDGIPKRLGFSIDFEKGTLSFDQSKLSKNKIGKHAFKCTLVPNEKGTKRYEGELILPISFVFNEFVDKKTISGKYFIWCRQYPFWNSCNIFGCQDWNQSKWCKKFYLHIYHYFWRKHWDNG